MIGFESDSNESDELDGTVVVAVVTMRVVEVTFDEIVGVVTVRDCLVTAARSVFVLGRMARAAMRRCAVGGVLPTDGDRVVVDVVGMRMVEMTIV